MTMLERLAGPIIQAPMAGGPSTPELAAAVADAGGLGFSAAGYKTPDALAADLDATRALTRAPLAVNVFGASGAPADPDAVAAYAQRLAPEAERLGTPLGEPRFDDDHLDKKLALLVARAPDDVAAVSFTFACPDRAVVRRLQESGKAVWVTITTPDEARAAAASGADALIVQGTEAGGHRGAFADTPDATNYGLLALLALVRDAVDVDTPLIATGGIMTAAAVSAVLAAGARAAQVGTAFMLTPEAGTSAPHRAAIKDPNNVTTLTRAYTGRLARGIVNRLHAEHGAAAPIAYPELHHITAPLRAAARAAGDPDVINLWAGEAHALAQERPAAEVVKLLTP
jgi:nitronate monooxygenase